MNQFTIKVSLSHEYDIQAENYGEAKKEARRQALIDFTESLKTNDPKKLLEAYGMIVEA